MSEWITLLLDIVKKSLELGITPGGQQALINVLTPVKGDLDKMLAAQKDAPQPKGLG